jgi:hypothetical protein
VRAGAARSALAPGCLPALSLSTPTNSSLPVSTHQHVLCCPVPVSLDGVWLKQDHVVLLEPAA